MTSKGRVTQAGETIDSVGLERLGRREVTSAIGVGPARRSHAPDLPEGLAALLLTSHLGLAVSSLLEAITACTPTSSGAVDRTRAPSQQGRDNTYNVCLLGSELIGASSRSGVAWRGVAW